MVMTETEIDLADRLAVMEGVARRAGALALHYFLNRDQLLIETKRVLTDMVSQADREVEELIRDEIKAAYPEDAFLGEEYGLEPGSSALTWVIDPIDGTAPYLNGLPGWCISIGLMDENGPLLGAIYVPVLDEMFLGGRGLGATLNGQPIRVTDRFDLKTGILGVGANDRIPAARIGQLQAELAGEGIAARVVSMPCTNVFDRQNDDYKAAVLGACKKRIAIEAAHPDFWRKYVGLHGAVIGIDRFGESAPAGQLFDLFGFTVGNVVATAKSLLS